MKQTTIRLFALLLSGAALLLSTGASAYEHRTVNGYQLLFDFYFQDYTSEDNWSLPLLLVNTSKGKPVRAKDLNDPGKNEIHVKMHYYGTEDKPENYGATPLETVDLGKYPQTDFDGFLYNIPLRPGATGAYGFQFTGILNGRFFDELFVCGKGSQDPNDVPPAGGHFHCVGQAVAFPGPQTDAYRQYR
jgi:hypothetical protein